MGRRPERLDNRPGGRNVHFRPGPASGRGTVSRTTSRRSGARPFAIQRSARHEAVDEGLRRLDRSDKQANCHRRHGSCPRGTKEHESIIAADTRAYAVHAGLLAVGAEAGTPVQYQPEYKPATGSEIEVELVWTDKEGKVHRDRAQNWIRNVKTGKPLEHPWVFGGSGFWQDEVTGEKAYLAESGDFICVSNFPTAMLDLPVESSQSNDALLFDAFTERIPPLGTRVRMVLTPKAKK
jgi:hypothetical protein